jgi:hypothetical protein
MAYVGTGSLQTSGAPASDIASHTVSVMDCDAVDKPQAAGAGELVSQPASPAFTVLRVGSDCIIDGVRSGSQVVGDTGGVCTLTFADGPRTLRVTDILVRYGISADDSQGLESDPNLLEMTLGGDDVATGVHAVYRFKGGGKPVARSHGQCSAQRPVHDRYLSVQTRGEARANPL